ncbi:SMP-30/gluconolactonase/LRE family protein [Novipirellula artificiosorum]|uniref:Gluconolactonase n=1 Tax=Novipirellula artificiosorum TaxID=2528016 RepID=A0A5C6DYU6_9BACT|nr:SMP-30/gluconolactonase/LRE family protein [Novipirellula artificiosorum]TWU42613.1 Gluconolactonase precursor [Novipirellula artificiosorum]
MRHFRRRVLFFAFGCLVSIQMTLVARSQSPTAIGRVEAIDPAFSERVAADAKIEVLAKGFTWSEGPLWVADDDGGHLLFSDIPRNSIFRWSAARGVELFMKPSGYTGDSYYGLEPGSNGLALDRQGRLVACEHGDRRVSVLTPSGGKMTLADRFEGKRLNSPNDLTIDSSGVIYFTDPPYGLPDGAADPRRELDFCGVYRLAPDGALSLLTKQFSRPNGIGLSPDEKTLYVAQSDSSAPILMALPINEDQTLGEGKVLFDATEYAKTMPGAPDGMAVAKDGMIYCSGPGAVYLITPEGKLLGRIITGGRISNCTLSGDQKTLYMTADDKLCRVQLK